MNYFVPQITKLPQLWELNGIYCEIEIFLYFYFASLVPT